MNLRIVEKTIRVIFIFVFVVGAICAPNQSAMAQSYDPHFNVARNGNFLWLYSWPIGSILTASFDDPVTGPGVDFRITDITVAEFAFGVSFDGEYHVDAGCLVTISDGTTSFTHVVKNLAILSANSITDIVTGIAEPGTPVWVGSHGNPLTAQFVDPDASGYWEVDFSSDDIQPGYVVVAHQGDANMNTTQWDFNVSEVSSPIINAGPNQGFVYARNWPTGIAVHMIVARSGSTIYTSDVLVGPCGAGNPGAGPCGPNDAYFDLGYGDSDIPRLDLLPGDVITITGGGIIRSMIVSALQVTEADASTDTIKGIANPGREVYPGVCGSGGFDISVMPDSGGHWEANLAPYDLIPGECGGATQYDENGNFTQQGWVVPYQYIQASITNRWIQASEWDWPPIHGNWTPGIVLTLTIDDSSNGMGIDYTGAATVEQNPDNPSDPNDYRANFAWPDIGLQPGFTVMVSGNGTSKTLTISPLQVEYIDVQADTISGRASPGASIEVCANILNNCIRRFVTADGGGNWLANYHDPGTQQDEQETVDIQRGTDGWANERDEDGDSTMFSWYVPLNQPPDAKAGTDQIAFAGETITLDASTSSDPEAGTLTYAWDLDNDGQYDDANGETITTSFNQTGDHVIGLQVTDDGGSSDSDTVTITVLAWTLNGFYQPVDMNNIYNLVKGGSTVPLKFEIFAGSTELTDIAHVKNLTYAETTCSVNAVTDEIELVATGETSLRYDAASGQFIYNWKTPKTTGKCYRVTMATMDGSSLMVYFKLK